MLTATQIQANNPRGARRGRYFCPNCQLGGGKTPDLSVDERRGVYHCFKCGESGSFHERHEARRSSRVARPQPRRAPTVVPEAVVPEEYVELCRTDFPGSAADEYERGRGIDGVRTAMGFDAAFPFLVGDEWIKEPAVIFFFHDLHGRCVAKQGRMLRQPEDGETAKITFGRVSQGVFNRAALDAPEVFLCEGPNTAAALVERGYAAVALGGKSVQDWVLDAIVDKKVFVAFDNDGPGRMAAKELMETLTEIGCDAHLCLPPTEGDDWNDALRRNPRFEIPGATRSDYRPTLTDLWAYCRRQLRTARGEARELLEDWEFALTRGDAPARNWWRRNGTRLCALL